MVGRDSYMSKTGNPKLEIRNSVREQVTARNPEGRTPNAGQDLEGNGFEFRDPKRCITKTLGHHDKQGAESCQSFAFPVSGMVLSWCLGVLVVRFC